MVGPDSTNAENGGTDAVPLGSSGAVYTVGQLTTYLKEVLDSNPALFDIWVSGEVSNHRKPGSGHHYFSLRDADSVVRCVMFRPGRGGEFLSDGSQVLVHGRVSLYKARGDLQLYVDMVRAEGLGALQQAFEELKLRLESEGLFDPARKRPLPRFPATIAVVTSPDGAALQDILNILSRRYPLADVLVVPTQVQGDAAAPGIVAALSTIAQAQGIDVVIVTRGGGSLEDLWPFNEEMVARAIFSCPVPVISAVGHETDVTISDLVADVRAPTPSAAAELVAPHRADLLARSAEFAEMIGSTVRRLLSDRRIALNLAADRLGDRSPDTRVYREQIDVMLRSGRLAITGAFEAWRARTRALEAELRALGPEQVLGRGYAIVRKGADGPVLVSASETSPGESLEITLAEGKVEAETRVTHPGRQE